MFHIGRLAAIGWIGLAIGCGSGRERGLRSEANDLSVANRVDRTAPAINDGTTLRARSRATTRRAGGVRDITFDDLEFPIERDAEFDASLLTDAVRALEGQPVVLRGFILASTVFQQTGIRQFVLVRDNQECCFGPGAYLYHNAQVELVPPHATDFTIRPVTVQGTLSIRPYTVGGKTYSVFHILADRIDHY